MTRLRTLGLSLASVLACASVSLGCERRAPAEELARLRDEARKEDERRRAEHELVAARPTSIEIRTASSSDRRILSWAELDAMATDEVETSGPAPDTGYTKAHRYRGVRLSRLVGSLDGGADDDVVLMGADGFFTTLDREDVLRAPILLALERDGARIPRSLGGPLMNVLPLDGYPDLAQRYGENGWCFYVTGVATGRPRPILRIDREVREPSFLVRAGLVTRKQTLRFRLGWPPGEVTITGPRLSSLLAPGWRTVKIWSMGRSDADAMVATAEEVRECDPLVVVGDAPNERAVPISMGGPALIAPLPTCRAPWAQRAWPAFVDTIEGQGRP